jgi:glutamate N-acetyltransferase / amino-acid N-acetyltransferase
MTLARTRSEQGADEVAQPLPSTLPAILRAAVLPLGFVAAGGAVGIKRSGRPDLAIVALEPGRAQPAAAAAVFTRHPIAAAPVRLSRAHLAATMPAGDGGYGWARAVVATSGSANAGTGADGDADQLEIAAALATALGVPIAETLAMSTGIIGTRLPVAVVAGGIKVVVGGLATEGDGLLAAAEAIRTTDSTTKVAAADAAPGRPRVTGIAKGVGMIHPGMATMLSLVLTDAALQPAQLHEILRRATARTWNQLTVDGDTSTNDTVIALASGAHAGAQIEPGSAAEADLAAAFEAVARDLARQQAADGEGATTLLTCQVSGAADDADARAVARAVVASSLVKAAVHGRDPNWGRIAAAAGNAHLPSAAVLIAGGVHPIAARHRAGEPARLDPALLRIAVAGSVVFSGPDGGPMPFDRDRTRAAMDAPELLVRLDLGLGTGAGEAFGCDLTKEYVTKNAEYTT